jgi:cytoskeletal protein RodZ
MAADHKAEQPEALLRGKDATGGEPSLGKSLIEARKRRGLSADDVAREAHVPAHYMRMIENDDYGLISDQLYVLPFLRRYAAFVGLDPEEVATRFVREVQRADTNAARMAEPIAVMKPARDRRTWIVAAAAAAVLILALILFLIFRHRGAPHAASSATATASLSPLSNAPSALPPPPPESEHP